MVLQATPPFTIHSRGGATFITSWGKFWLAVLGVFSWDGMNPLTPEMWLLPYSKWSGIGMMHPGRFWCHCRLVYLPMSYVYGRQGTCKPTALTAALRTELFVEEYGSIDWNKARNLCAKEDLYYPHPPVQDWLWWSLYKAENVLRGSWLRDRALKEIMTHIHYEDRNTRYIDIGPVNKVINMLCCWLENPQGEEYQRHLPRVHDYLWVAEDGLKMQGYNGSQLWDTAFAVQALIETGLSNEVGVCLKKAHDYIHNSQVVEEAAAPLSKYYRHISKGAWPFSTRDHGWPISDCSSEGLKAALALALEPDDLVGSSVPAPRLNDCVNVILSYQNADGGMATYENTRSFHWLEVVNPAETFGDIIVDYSYVECTSACITALVAFRKQHPHHRKAEIQASLNKAEAFVRSTQRPDGSWYGSWGVCFTYGCWFGAAGLAAMGWRCDTDGALRRCCDFIAAKQRADGGWGESYLSCQDKVYSQLDGDSHVVNTAWAMMTLISAGHHLRTPAHPSSLPPSSSSSSSESELQHLRQTPRAALARGAAFLTSMQTASGDWPQQHISGVFNRNSMITYANYRNIFPLWALGLFRRHVLLEEALPL
ncbi:MAG: hypothetical protein WDW38_010738 [Sanguina aurantia]